MASALLLAPACVLFALFVVWPIGQNIALSLHAWNGVTPPAWVGIANYREMFADPVFWRAAANNLRWLALYGLAPLIGLAAALLFHQSLPGMRAARALFFMPFVVSQVGVGVVFAWLFNARFGPLGELGLLDREDSAIYGVIIAGLWPQSAYCMILYLTGLASIRPELIEAARMDGARGLRLLWHVVLPQLRPVSFIVAMVCVVSALRSFDYVMVMTGGGPHNSSTVLAFYLYEQAFIGLRYGYAAAIATVLLALMSGIVGVLLWRLVRRERT